MKQEPSHKFLKVKSSTHYKVVVKAKQRRMTVDEMVLAMFRAYQKLEKNNGIV